MLNRPSSFKKSSRAVTAVAAVGMFVSASFMATGPAGAQQVVSASPCDSIKNSAAAIKCEFQQSQIRTKANEARGAAAEDAIACITDLQKFKAKNPDGFAKLGPISRETACSAAAKIPRPTASLN